VTRERVTVAPLASSPEGRRAIVERARRRGFAHFAVEEGDPFEAAPGEEVIVRGSGLLTTRDRASRPSA